MPSRIVKGPKPGDRRYVTKWVGRKKILPMEPAPDFGEDGSTLVEKWLCFSGVKQIYINHKGWVDLFWEFP